MRVAVGPDQGHDLDAVAANLPDHVAEDAERGDGLDLVGRFRAAGEPEQQYQRQANLHEDAMFHDTNSLS